MAAVKKHLREFLWLDELALNFGMADFELKLNIQIAAYFQRENGKLQHCYTTAAEMEIPFPLGQEGQSEN